MTCQKFGSVTQRDLQGVVSSLLCPVGGPYTGQEHITRRKKGLCKAVLASGNAPLQGPYPNLKILPQLLDESDPAKLEDPLENKRSLPKMEEPSFQNPNFCFTTRPT